MRSLTSRPCSNGKTVRTNRTRKRALVAWQSGKAGDERKRGPINASTHQSSAG